MTDHPHDIGLSLVADIGGTNTRVALARGSEIDRQTVRRYPNKEHPGLGAVLQRYLVDLGVDANEITGACAAGAGPVRGGVVTLTNLAWRIDRTVLNDALTASKVGVLNDLQAQGHAIGYLDPEDLQIIVPQPDVSALAAKLVVGLGTGFNACPVFDTAAGRFVPPSEAGHVSFPSCGGRRSALVDAMMADFGFASVEEVLSGRGISYVHRVLHGIETDPASIMAALAEGDTKAKDTAAVFIEVMGVVVGDLALSHLPFGGIYLVGGVTRAFAPYLERFGFADHMANKGRFSEFIGQFGVFIVEDDYAALTGCASHLSKMPS